MRDFNDCVRHRVTIIKLCALLALTFLASPAALAASPEDEIAERIRKVGQLCLEGEDCARAAPGAGSGQLAAASIDIEGTYNRTCATCHIAGVAGAPKLGDVPAWAPRLEKGTDALYQSAINGMPPAMPAKGMCFACTDDDLRALVDYMLESLP